jgi:hypothetical protein
MRHATVVMGALACGLAMPAAEGRAADRPETPAAPDTSGPGAAPPTGAGRAAAIRELRDVSLAGMDRRLGPDYAAFHKDAKDKDARFSLIWAAPDKQENGGRRYQIGGPWTKQAGDYSSTQGQVLYVPDRGFGVDRVTVLEWSNGCFSERPEAPWWGGFRPEPTAKAWEKAAGGDPGVPVAMARGMGSWANCGVIVFSSGLVGTAGTCTAKGSDPAVRLPPSKIPTAVSVTNKNEFALVTVVDTETRKGQVAVFALESSSKKNGFAHEWPDEYPGLPNVAVFTGLKLLGYVDLPGIEFPTGVCAVGDRVGGRVNGPDGNAGVLRTFNLSEQRHRDAFYKGPNAGYVSASGFAVVISRYDNKAAFLDLQPLFQRVREVYFTTEANFRKTRDMGPDPKQWPHAFEADPSWRPKVVKVVAVQRPTAVLATMSGGPKARAFIASVDGRVGIWTVGGLATDAPADAREIDRVGEVRVGRNPTCLAYQKHSSDTFLAVSRGDREIAWVRFGEKGGEVVRRLRDARLIDPVHVEVADTHGIETNLITVADFKGRKIVNYRCSRVVFATQGGAVFGMGPSGKDEFECGVMEFPGSPFCISAANVN